MILSYLYPPTNTWIDIKINNSSDYAAAMQDIFELTIIFGSVAIQTKAD